MLHLWENILKKFVKKNREVRDHYHFTDKIQKCSP